MFVWLSSSSGAPAAAAAAAAWKQTERKNQRAQMSSHN